jgi:predicted XRE-type DNA-binding protein
MKSSKVDIEEGSGNIFADLGLPEADVLLLKSQIVTELSHLVQERGLTQTESAKLMGIAQPDLSNLVRGDLRGYSVERLIRMLTVFDRDVEIVVKPRKIKDKAGRITFKSDEVHKGSSALVSISYDAPIETLKVRFHDGSTYCYFDVPAPIYEALLKDSSRSLSLLAKIRDQLNFSAYLPHVEFDQQSLGGGQPTATKADVSRQRKEGVRRKSLSSSTMRSVGYDAAAKILEIEFPDGDVYRYFEVPPEIWRAFENAPSKGLFFSGEIRDRFSFERVGKTRSRRSVKEMDVNTGPSSSTYRTRSAVRR